MNSITTQNNKKNIFKKILKAIIVATFWIFIWEAASRIVSANNELLLLILPSPFTVFKKWLEIAFTAPYIKATLFSLIRVFSGFLIGALIGFFLGVITHISNFAYSLLSPVLKLILTVPVVAIIILVYLFFETNYLPIFIVCLMVLPLIWQTVNDGLKSTDKSLLEMSKVYKLSTVKTLLSVKLPYLLPNLITACVNALGLAWKSGIAAEVICLPDSSLGTLLWRSKGNVNFDEVYAVTLTVVFLSILIEIFLKHLCKKHILGNGGSYND